MGRVDEDNTITFYNRCLKLAFSTYSEFKEGDGNQPSAHYIECASNLSTPIFKARMWLAWRSFFFCGSLNISNYLTDLTFNMVELDNRIVDGTEKPIFFWQIFNKLIWIWCMVKVMVSCLHFLLCTVIFGALLIEFTASDTRLVVPWHLTFKLIFSIWLL